MAEQAGAMKKKAEMMMMAGLALILIGGIMMATLPIAGQIAGAALIVYGAAFQRKTRQL